MRGASPVIVLSFKLWQRRFGGAPDIVGRTTHGERHALHRSAASRPDGFHGVNSLFGPDAWVPTSMSDQVLPAQLRTGWTSGARSSSTWRAD